MHSKKKTTSFRGSAISRVVVRGRRGTNTHIHSTFSDGKLSPSQLVDALKKIGRKKAVITDHDNFRAYTTRHKGKNLLEIARAKKLRMTTGAEFNCRHNGISIEILGYHFNPRHPTMLKLQDKTMDTAKQRAQNRIDYLKTLGFKIQLKEVNPFDFTDLDKELTAPKNAKLMSQKLRELNAQEERIKANPAGTLRSLLFAKSGSKYPIKKERFVHANQVINSIRTNGGIAVLAHPLQYFRGLPLPEQESKVTQLLASLKVQGLRGVEVEYVLREGTYSKIEIQMLRRIARKLKLKIFAGTDFHLPARDEL
jgi:3',5'-nucleoside bisphosphate phosphatase